MLDTISSAKAFAMNQIIIFFSHQWLAWEEPDPENIHFSCMAKVTNIIMKKSEALEKEVWVWVDYR